MATERVHTSDDHSPYPDELDPLMTDDDDDDLPPITAEDITHLVERLEASHGSGEYTNMRESDLVVLWHVGQLGKDVLHEVTRNPSLLPRLIAPTAHA